MPIFLTTSSFLVSYGRAIKDIELSISDFRSQHADIYNVSLNQLYTLGSMEDVGEYGVVHDVALIDTILKQLTESMKLSYIDI